ncbi:FAD-dependent oxidoreductase [Nitritalea halalkaliphila]|uniref:FAD-dependent oxidoreductase n=1 Tax=Nitritalea halalkaliphila TaxID=590849 RepID=UPI002934F42D|nr:FAD-dependent oxidoreductase [Nitritalea halalkaliphila]
MPKTVKKYTLLVIGGGLAGLVSAILLRKAGHQVTLVEKKSLSLPPRVRRIYLE